MAKGEPEWVKAFATSRWRGHTFFLCTQDGNDLNLFVRRRIGKHVHLIRAFGLERSTRYEWERFARVDSTAEQKKGFSYDFPFPKDVYGWYRSADTHAMKKEIPWKKLRILAIAPLGVVALGFFIWSRLHSGVPEEVDQQIDAQAGQRAPQAAPQAAPAVPVNPLEQPPLEGPAWVAQFVERTRGQPLSPRFYDATLKPKTFPKIDGCMEIKGDGIYRCTCNTQQGTIITTILPAECRHYLANGWFDFSEPDRSDDERRASSSAAAATTAQPSLGGLVGDTDAPGAVTAVSGAQLAP